jgi:protocatechuate 3,4-dioxygenase beta subunit
LLVACKIQDLSGKAISGVKIDIWETDSTGHYDVQYAGREGPDGRAVMESDEKGEFWFKAIRPVSYPIPHDGPVGKLLKVLARHPWRPAHMHFMFEKKGWDHLITALYIPPDEYMTSDAVFGVKESLIVPLSEVSAEQAEQFGVGKGMALLEHTFVLVTEEETLKLRDKKALEAMKKLFPGKKVSLLDHLPVPDLY